MFFFFDSEDPESTGMDMSLFESIKHINEYGQEYWEARELQPVLEYRQWRQFSDVIAKAMEACEASDGNVPDHFADVRKIVKAGATSKPVEDFRLSRYACYLSASKGRSCPPGRRVRAFYKTAKPPPHHSPRKRWGRQINTSAVSAPSGRFVGVWHRQGPNGAPEVSYHPYYTTPAACLQTITEEEIIWQSYPPASAGRRIRHGTTPLTRASCPTGKGSA